MSLLTILSLMIDTMRPLDIARIALERLKLDDEERSVLKTLVESGSVREASKRLYGSRYNRKRVREVLRNVLNRLLEEGLVETRC